VKHPEFGVGKTFWCGGQAWRCTDIGTRIITALPLGRDGNPSWNNGPPYAVAEAVFDEDDQQGCLPEPPCRSPEASNTLVVESRLTDTIRHRFAPLGGVDLELPPRAGPTASLTTALSPVEQARALLPKARKGGLLFEAYLPPALAVWLLEQIARDVFASPSEAAFVLLQEGQELSPHAELREEFLRRRLQTSTNDPRPPISAEVVHEDLAATLAAPQSMPTMWRKARHE
jgi:antitoxin ParD1/3/4